LKYLITSLVLYRLKSRNNLVCCCKNFWPKIRHGWLKNPPRLVEKSATAGGKNPPLLVEQSAMVRRKIYHGCQNNPPRLAEILAINPI
jgi:hypothetical protein